MKLHAAFLSVLLLFSAAFRPCLAVEPDATARLVLQVDDERIQAMIRNDAKAVSESLSEQLIYGHSDGRVQTKQELLAALASNRVQYRSVRYIEREVHPLGDNRAVTGVATFSVASKGQPLTFTLRFLAVYLLEDGHWRLAAYQSAQLPQ
ncbi:hypothetical protein DB347_22855 [Opitutaceae bacterium EW11]|nr:hypothetical protein DB347_22855 [Opitutaceae bacterium EW11]